LSLDRLEDRTLPSVLPLPVISGHNPIAPPPVTGSTTFSRNLSDPSIAVDPSDPNTAVAVWVQHDHNTLANPPDTFSVKAAFTMNAGGSWNSLSPTLSNDSLPANLTDPLHSSTTTVVSFPVSSDPSVAFDRNGFFYILESEHAVDNSSGALVLFRGQVTSGIETFPQQIGHQFGGPLDDPTQGKILYEWVGDQVVRPSLAVDAGVSTFTDQGVMQTDPSAGNVYVSWATNNAVPSGTLPAGTPFNPNTIRIIASHDNGNTFTPATSVNDGFASPFTIVSGNQSYAIPGQYFGTERDTAPVLATSQGTAASSLVPGGQLTVAFDDFGTGTVQPPAEPFSLIKTDRITDPAVGAFARADFIDSTPGSPTFGEITSPGQINDNGVTLFNLVVPASTSTDFTSISDLQVSLAMVHANMAEVGATLIPPSIHSAQAQGGSQTTLTLDSLASSVSGFYDGDFIVLTGGAGAGQFGRVSDYNGATKVATIAGSWVATPDNTTTFQITDFSPLVLFQPQQGNGNIGVTGANLGALDGPAAPGFQGFTGYYLGNENPPQRHGTIGVDTTFDQHASRSIIDRSAQNHLVGHFLPEGNNLGQSLAQFDGMSRAEMVSASGWNLMIRDTAADMTHIQFLINWSLDFTSGFTPQAVVTAASTDVHGALTAPYPLKPTVSPDTGIGPGISIASDNTLGVNSSTQGSLYIAYVGHIHLLPPNVNPADNTDIRLLISNDGGASWFNYDNTAVPLQFTPDPLAVNDDLGRVDGFSDSGRGSIASALLLAGRPHYQPSVAVDPLTGTLVVTWYDARYDAGRARVARFMATSIDGGSTFGPQTFLNIPNAPFDEITRQDVSIGPIPDNDSSGNNDRDAVLGFGEHQGLAVIGGRVYSAWSGDENGGTDGVGINNADFTERFGILSAQVTIAGGPRIIDGRQGLVIPGGFLADGTPILNSFTVTFDRPVDPTTFDGSDVTIVYRNVHTPGQNPGIPITTGITVNPITAADTAFQISFPNQTGVGTYSYAIGPHISSRIKAPDGSEPEMDQDQDANPFGATGSDVFAIPRPLNGGGPPFDPGTQPIIIPGPHVVSTSVPNGSGPDNLVLNSTVSSFTLTFDRDINPLTFTGASVLRLMGPLGLIGPEPGASVPASFTVTQINSRTFQINFLSPDGMHPLALDLNGTYTLSLSSSISSVHGDALDTNLNAGVDMLRDVPSAGSIPVVFTSAASVPIGPGTSTSTITVPDNFLLTSSLGLTVSLDITYPNDPDLTATLIAPNGRQITLFAGVGNSGTLANFTSTVIDDTASTAITAGGPPFAGRFAPQQPLGDLFRGGQFNSAGNWMLQIANAGSQTGTINSWSLTLQKPVPSTGLGEPVADQYSTGFRIFTMDPTNPLSHNTWTSVGPGENGTGHGRIGGIALDPSDPSGNTVYVAGASGGVWKTTDFLTNSTAGPTYIPLTDFGPTFGINIGGLAVFGRNGDPNQSIVFAATGEGDTGTTGVGFLRSMDGGATWTLLDSSTNVDASGNILPLSSPMRDHILVGTNAFKVLVDPRLTPTGEVIVYAALSGTNGGVWRSLDTGKHWQRMRGGSATDIVFDPNSGHINTVSNPTGNLDVIFAGFRGEGVFESPNRGGTWNQLLGGFGDPLIQDRDTTAVPVPVPVAGPGGVPNGSKGRIVLAKPALTGQILADGSYVGGNPLEDLLIEGWLYVMVAGTDSHLDGLYLTKDFGQNWTKIHMPNEPSNQAGIVNAIPTNNPSQPDYDVLGGGLATQGNYDITLAVDPNNPNVVYLGGTSDFQPTGFIRVDTTGVADPHAFFFGNNNADGGALLINTTSPVSLKNWPIRPGRDIIPLPNDLTAFPLGSYDPIMNFIRNPVFPLDNNATSYTSNVAQFANTGTGARWIPFDIGGTDQHRIVTLRDPLTGEARIIIGDDQGIFSALDLDGVLSTGAVSGEPEQGGGRADRNGNLQVAQFYYGASQPSSAAAQIAGALFYSGVQDGASNISTAGVLTTGNLTWGNTGEGDGGGVATDQTGTGVRYEYMWPCCGGNITDFFRVDGVGRTFGLVQQSSGGSTPDPQWPFEAVLNFTVNPISPDQIAISSNAGRVFATADRGFTWFVIGEPTTGAVDGSVKQALAYGAPDPADPSGALNDFLYVGSNAGHIFVTFTGGGANGNQWLNLSAGLDGSAVRAIVTNPTRGSHEAYAVTNLGVFHMVDATATGATWQNISGNLFQLTHNFFTNLVGPQCRTLEAIQADWRYAIPNDPNELINPVTPPGPTHPVLYVGGEGGVFRSVDNGTTWTNFPDQQTDGARQLGGFLPVAHVTDLQLALGNVDPTNGRGQVSSSPDVLFATTYGRGAFAIRVAPVIVANSMFLDAADLVGPNTTNQLQPIIHGMSELGAFGNTVTIRLLDANGNVVGQGTTDGTGRFSATVLPGALRADGSQDGPVTFRVEAVDGAGAIGQAVPFTFTLDTHPRITSVVLSPASDSGRSNTDGITNVIQPTLTGTVIQSGPVTINVFDVTGGGSTLVGSATSNANGTFSVQINLNAHVSPDLLTINLNVVAVHVRPSTVPFSLVLDTVLPPVSPPQLQGDTGNHVTSRTTPTFTGTGEPSAQVILKANGVEVDNPATPTFVDSTGHYAITVSASTPLVLGNSYQITVRMTDVAGNVSADSAPPLTISVVPPIRLDPPTISLDRSYNIGLSGQNTANVIPQLYDGTSDPGTTVVIKDGVAIVDTFTVDSTGHFSRFLSLVDGTHSLTVTATDSMGDTASSASPLIVVVNTTLTDTNQKFVRGLYLQILGRTGSPAEWNAWIQLLGQPNARFVIANDIEHSFEARDRVVRGWYQTYLGRTPANGEEVGFALAMVNGATEEHTLSLILGSPEYFNHAPSIPGVGGTPSNSTFIKALYVQLLGRQPAQSEINLWLPFLASNSLGFAGVAQAIYGQSVESRAIVVTTDYNLILVRAPSAAEVSAWVNSGLDFITIRDFLESSAEFYFRVTGVLPPGG
jgi:subtilisin-like proprotein convertase family protein